MNSRLRLIAWQIDVIAHERSERLEGRDDGPGHVAKWEGGGPQNRYERVRFSPWPKITARIRASIQHRLGQAQTPRT